MKPIIILLILLFIEASAQDLKTSVEEIINTNPVILERAKNYKSTQKDIDIAISGYYPKIDLSLGLGFEKTNKKTPSRGDESFDFSVYQNSLKYTQNIFEGFNTYHKVQGQEYRTTAAAYSYVEKVNTTTLDMVNTYLELVKNQELLATAQRNVDINTEILRKVKRLYEAGLTTLSEVHKIESSLALALSNFVVQENTLLDASYNLGRVLGRQLNPLKMQRPVIKTILPTTRERATEIALHYNPSLLVSQYNVKLAEATRKEKKSPFYPKIDIEVAELLNKNLSAIEGNEDRFRAMAYLSYNLFNGFADSAALEQSEQSLYQEQEKKNSIKRQVIESLNLAWNAHKKLEEQVVHLIAYKKYSKKTLNLYSKEFDLGHRSLLDLLAAQNDYIKSDVQIISTQYSMLYANYRLMDSMGTLVSSILGDDASKIYESVSLSINKQD
ncbi:TolC family outer membrane protein [Sulfurimonas sp. SAG-AH-194-C21]|nr:TolC family outer membrane protein [Sulfurimonas sp. SAG-AH-194-C21]MDF1884037.1 TolC family outer membrane protein [Sulfurimonas sp. SAG-AH-194-C21]